MTGRNGRTGRGPAATIAAGIAVAGVVGLGLLTLQGGAGAQPALPPVSPEDLVTSVLKAQPGPFEGTVQLDNELGLPALPDLPQAANGTSTAQVWSGGEGKGRVQIPSPTGERTLVSDGTTFWAWNSDDRTVTKGTRQPDQNQTQMADPTKAATDALAALQPTSTISVDGTDEVAGRPVYDLVLAPKPTERTLLREVRHRRRRAGADAVAAHRVGAGLDVTRAAGGVHRPHVRPAGPGRGSRSRRPRARR